MASCSLTLTGNIVVGGDACGACVGGVGSSAARKVQPLAFACPGVTFAKVVSTDCPSSVDSALAFVPIPGDGELSAYQFVYIRTNQAMTLRLDAEGANAQGATGTFPTGFGGGETFSFRYDTRQTDGSFVVDFTVAVTFTAAAQSAQDVANEINAAAALLGQPAIASVVNGQVLLTDPKRGADRKWTNVTPNATIGFAAGIAERIGKGEEIPIQGIFMAEFGASSTLSRIEVKGSGTIEVLAAGAA